MCGQMLSHTLPPLGDMPAPSLVYLGRRRDYPKSAFQYDPSVLCDMNEVGVFSVHLVYAASFNI